MAWTAPMTAVANTAFTAAQFNTNVRDNLNETAPAKATTAGSIFVGTGTNSIAERIPTSAFVNAAESTASTSYGALTTAGPVVTVTSGIQALVIIACKISNSSAGGRGSVSFAVSGATTIAAADSNSMSYESGAANAVIRASWVYMPQLSAGSNTFTLQYRAAVAGTATFEDRRLTVIPL